MTLEIRDVFAAIALTKLMVLDEHARLEPNEARTLARAVARSAYDIADALIAERRRREKKEENDNGTT